MNDDDTRDPRADNDAHMRRIDRNHLLRFLQRLRSARLILRGVLAENIRVILISTDYTHGSPDTMIAMSLDTDRDQALRALRAALSQLEQEPS